mmetsp:Transcript_39194/g.54660  ORF Transcript_39194/g.54660 Transcript_39194/m.54660 type:complete len:204 (-) Transcript_39194:831-1442(-)
MKEGRKKKKRKKEKRKSWKSSQNWQKEKLRSKSLVQIRVLRRLRKENMWSTLISRKGDIQMMFRLWALLPSRKIRAETKSRCWLPRVPALWFISVMSFWIKVLGKQKRKRRKKKRRRMLKKRKKNQAQIRKKKIQRKQKPPMLLTELKMDLLSRKRCWNLFKHSNLERELKSIQSRSRSEKMVTHSRTFRLSSLSLLSMMTHL